MERSLWRSAGTYLLAVACGWGGAALLRGKEMGEGGTGGEGRFATRTERPVSSPRPERDIINRLLDEQAKEKEQGENILKVEPRTARFLELRKTLAPGKDRAATFESAFADFEVLRTVTDDPEIETKRSEASAVLNVRFLQWLENEPDAALAYAKANPKFYQGDLAFWFWSNELPTDQALARMKEATGRYASSMMSGMLARVGEKADVKALELVFGQVPVKERSRASLVSEAMRKWPKEQRPLLVPLAMAEKDGPMLGQILYYLSSPDLCRQIEKLLSTDDGRALLEKARAGLPQKIYENIGIPAEKRLALIQQLSNLDKPAGGEAPSLDAREAVMQEWVRIYYSGDSTSVINAYSSGALSAEIALAQLTSLMPDASRLAPEELKEKLINELIKRDVGRGLHLLDDLPDDKRYRAVTDFANREFKNGQVQQMYDLFEAVPFDPKYGNMNERFQAWVNVGDKAYFQYGDEYVTWITQLPPSHDRDMALSALAVRFERSNPAQAAKYRAMKTNPPRIVIPPRPKK